MWTHGRHPSYTCGHLRSVRCSLGERVGCKGTQARVLSAAPTAGVWLSDGDASVGWRGLNVGCPRRKSRAPHLVLGGGEEGSWYCSHLDLELREDRAQQAKGKRGEPCSMRGARMH